MSINIQRLRNLTTGLLHTDITFVYEDLEFITGDRGIMTHMIPRAIKAIEPWLRVHATDERLWDGKYDPSHVGEYWLPDPCDEDRESMFERFKGMPNPLDGKKVAAVLV